MPNLNDEGKQSSTKQHIHVRKEYFTGCKTYVYCKRGNLRYIYTDGDLVIEPRIKRTITLVLLSILFTICAILTIIKVVPPTKLKGTDDFEIVIKDNASVLTDTTELSKVLEEFKNKTGVVPAIYTTYNDKWVNYYENITVYAKDVYVNEFFYDGEEDQNHFLIVYSLPKPEDVNPSFVDWYFVEMQGANTDKVLTEKKVKRYIEIIDSNLRINSLSVDEALTKSFKQINEIAMDGGSIADALPQFIIGLVLLLVIAYMIIIDKFKGYRNKELVEVKIKPSEPIEKNCPYCGGLYVVGTHTTCPHCGASVKAENDDEILEDELEITKDVIDASEK